MYTYCQYLDHAEQCIKDSLDWFDVQNRKPLTEEQKAAFEAGCRQAFREAASLIKLHGNFKFAK